MQNDALPEFDLLLRGGTVIDGTRAPRRDADVGVRAGRIAAIGELAGCSAAQVIDARGRIVAPGFIDAHTHDDQALLLQPDLPFKASQGVTTVIAGNCGLSAAPLPRGVSLPLPLALLDSAAHARFMRFADYRAALERTPAAVNVAAFVGHSNLRVLAMPELQRAATAAEIEAMRGLLREALDAGALGLSIGTFYPPAAHAPTEEIVAVGRDLRAAGARLATHMRDESNQVMDSLEETFHIGASLGIPVVISHHKLQHQANFGRSRETLSRIRSAMQHQCVALDCYPYEAGSTMIRTDRGMLDGRVLIASSEPHPECAGRDLSDIARDWGVSREEAAQRLQPGSAITFLMDEDDVQRILGFEETMIGSDGLPLGEKPHPRLWGTFPRVLGRYSRDLGLFPLETAVWKMTGLTARNFGLHQRGTLAVGHAADIVVFDADTVRDTATYAEPQQPAAGIDWVIVNGAPTWAGGRSTGARSGRFLARA